TFLLSIPYSPPTVHLAIPFRHPILDRRPCVIANDEWIELQLVSVVVVPLVAPSRFHWRGSSIIIILDIVVVVVGGVGAGKVAGIFQVGALFFDVPLFFCLEECVDEDFGDGELKFLWRNNLDRTLFVSE